MLFRAKFKPWVCAVAVCNSLLLCFLPRCRAEVSLLAQKLKGKFPTPKFAAAKLFSAATRRARCRAVAAQLGKGGPPTKVSVLLWKTELLWLCRVHSRLCCGRRGGDGLFPALNQPHSPAPRENTAEGRSCPSELIGEPRASDFPRIFVFADCFF